MCCPIHRSTKHSFAECLVCKKQKQEDEQLRRGDAPVRQEQHNRHVELAQVDDAIVLLDNMEILTIYGGSATPTSKTKLKQVEWQVNNTQPSDKRFKWSEVPIKFDLTDHCWALISRVQVHLYLR